MSKKRKFIIIALTVLLSLGILLIAAVGIINAVVIGSVKGDIREFSAEDSYEVAVVFGAKVHEGGTLSPMLRDRMDTAIELYESGVVKALLLSGDDSGEWGEVTYMKKYAVEHGLTY